MKVTNIKELLEMTFADTMDEARLFKELGSKAADDEDLLLIMEDYFEEAHFGD